MLRTPGGLQNIERALDLGVDVVGGIPHFERTMADGAASVKLLCEIAPKRSKLVDMHCDESDDPLSRHQHHAARPTRQLPQAPGHDPRARVAGRRGGRGFWPRLRDGPLVQPGRGDRKSVV